MKKIVAITIGLFIAVVSNAQQQEQYSMYMMNNFMVNPAEGGTEEFIDLKMGYRTQWVGIDNNDLYKDRSGGPKTTFISGHAPLGKKTSRFDDVDPLPHHGVGGMISQDNIGVWSVLNVKASYSYHLPVTHDLMLSFGTFVGVQQYKYDAGQAQFDYFNAVDPAFGGSQSKLMPDMSLGIWAYASKYYFGISSFQLLGNKMDFTSNTQALNDVKAGTGSLARHFWVTGGYKVDLTDNYFLVPSFVVKYVTPSAPQVDLNAKFKYQDKAWVGVSYRNLDAVVALVGVTYKGLIDIAYSYDFGLSALNVGHSGSHEILLGLRLPNHKHEPPPAQFW